MVGRWATRLLWGFVLVACSEPGVHIFGDVIVRGPCDQRFVHVMDGDGVELARASVDGLTVVSGYQGCYGQGHYAVTVPERSRYVVRVDDGRVTADRLSLEQLRASEFVWHLVVIPAESTKP